MPTIWDYHVERIPDMSASEENYKLALMRLRELGEMGWELVSTHEQWLYFKQPRQPETPASG